MGESAATLNPYLLYSLLGYIALVWTASLVVACRILFLMSRILQPNL